MNNRIKYVFSTLVIMVVLLMLGFSFLILRDYSKNVLNKNETKINNEEKFKENNIEDELVVKEEVKEEDTITEEELKEEDISTSNNASVDIKQNTGSNSGNNNNNSNNSNSNSTNSNPQSSPESNNKTTNPTPNPDVNYSVIETYTGKITGYGPDCYGCTSQKTASGMYIGGGNIYYQDNTFGKIRIVAADNRYPFGTIVRISNLAIYQEPIYAVVLDRGGGVGDNKYAQFDLLFETEALATVIGLSTAKFEILRLGY